MSTENTPEMIDTTILAGNAHLAIESAQPVVTREERLQPPHAVHDIEEARVRVYAEDPYQERIVKREAKIEKLQPLLSSLAFKRLDERAASFRELMAENKYHRINLRQERTKQKLARESNKAAEKHWRSR